MAKSPAISGISMINAKTYFGDLAFTNYYQLFITEGWDPNGFPSFLKKPEVKSIYRLGGLDYTKLGLLCSEAVLPASAYATSEVKDNFMGVTQEFAHTRLFTDIDLTFYVDRDYTVLNFFEAWMNYISGGGEEPLSARSGYYRRFNYPDFYKNKSGIYIKKFERDYARGGEKSITYNLINAFPKSVASIPVAYGGADLLRVSVTFNYDYYIVNREEAPIQASNSVDNARKLAEQFDSNLSGRAYNRNPNDVFGTGLEINLGG
jgi:hypothetical protein